MHGRPTLPGIAGRAVGTLVVNAGLFLLIPALDGMFGVQPSSRELAARREVVLEPARPEKPPERRRRSRLREVVPSRGVPDRNPQTFRFQPDLSVQGEGAVALAGRDLEVVVFEEGETDRPPEPTYRPSIPYPPRARELGIEGALELELIVGRDGRVESVKIVSSPHPDFSSTARRVVSDWRFTPGMNKGVPVRVRVRQTIEFRLE